MTDPSAVSTAAMYAYVHEGQWAALAHMLHTIDASLSDPHHSLIDWLSHGDWQESDRRTPNDVITEWRETS